VGVIVTHEIRVGMPYCAILFSDTRENLYAEVVLVLHIKSFLLLSSHTKNRDKESRKYAGCVECWKIRCYHQRN